MSYLSSPSSLVWHIAAHLNVSCCSTLIVLHGPFRHHLFLLTLQSQPWAFLMSCFHLFLCHFLYPPVLLYVLYIISHCSLICTNFAKDFHHLRLKFIILGDFTYNLCTSLESSSLLLGSWIVIPTHIPFSTPLGHSWAMWQKSLQLEHLIFVSPTPFSPGLSYNLHSLALCPCFPNLLHLPH